MLSAETLEAVKSTALYNAARAVAQTVYSAGQTQTQPQANQIFLFSDGSAVMGDGGCVSASCGICIVPVCVNQQESSGSPGNTEGESSNLNTGTELNTNDICTVENETAMATTVSAEAITAGKTITSTATAGLGIGTVAAANAAVLAAKRAPIPQWDNALALSISDAGGLVDTPFDAELIAGLAAATVAKLIALAHEQEQPGESLTVPMTAYTDSKTLCRAVRTGPTGYLAERASSSRLTLWRLLSGHISNMENQNKACSQVRVEWTPGHPERRDCDRSR
jgi:hypothetical protein